MNDLAATGQRSRNLEQPIYAVNSWLVFLGICFIYLFFNWYLQTSVLSGEVYYNSMGGRISTDKLAAFFAGRGHMGILSYILVPVTLAVKFALVSFCLFAGLLLTSRNIALATLLKIVLFAESAFAAGTLLKLLLLAFSRDITSLGQLETFAPLSLFSCLKASSIPLWLSYPLQAIDVFQVGYFLLLAAGLRFFLGETFPKMLLLVLGSYGLGLLCSMIAFAFLSVTLMP